MIGKQLAAFPFLKRESDNYCSIGLTSPLSKAEFSEHLETHGITGKRPHCGERFSDTLPQTGLAACGGLKNRRGDEGKMVAVMNLGFMEAFAIVSQPCLPD